MLSIELQVVAARYLFDHHGSKSKIGRYGIQILRSLIKRSDLSIEQELQVAEVFDRFSGTDLIQFQPKNKKLSLLVQHPGLSIELRVFYLQRFYSKSSAESIQLLWNIAQDQALAINQRLQAINVFLSADNEDYINKTQAVRLVTSLLREDLVKHYLEERLCFRSFVGIQAKHLLLLVELVQLGLLPSKIRDEMYKVLRKMIPEFDKITTPDLGSVSNGVLGA